MTSFDAVEEALAHLSAWEPERALDALEMCRRIPVLLDDVAVTLKALAARLEEGPFDPAIPALLGDEVAYRVSAASLLADELEALFKERHEADLARLERPGAEMWDTSRNQ